MALDFGWLANDVRESIWIDDPALLNVSQAARDAWEEDGDASHLQPFAKNGQPTRITFGVLTTAQTQSALSFYGDSFNDADAFGRMLNLCFRMAVDFPDAPDEITTAEGDKVKRVVKEHGIRMLADPFVAALARKYPRMQGFYGLKVYRASFATDAEKKASSPPSTPTQLKVAG